MFQSEPDPAWHYAKLWEELRDAYFKMKEIEMKLSHPDAENQNSEVDKFVVMNLQEVREITNNWIPGYVDMFDWPEEVD